MIEAQLLITFNKFNINKIIAIGYQKSNYRVENSW